MLYCCGWYMYIYVILGLVYRSNHTGLKVEFKVPKSTWGLKQINRNGETFGDHWIAGSAISTLLHDKINPKDYQVLSLGDSGFLQIFWVVSSDIQKQSLGIQSPCQMMIGVYNHLLRKVFRFHYHSQRVIGSLGNCRATKSKTTFRKMCGHSKFFFSGSSSKQNLWSNGAWP